MSHKLNQLHAGLIIEEFERNGRDDSDWYVRVWCPETERAELYEYATTRGANANPTAKADCLPSVWQRYALKMQERERAIHAQKLIEKFERQEPHQGAIVEVIKGRKVKKGSRGKVLSVRKPEVAHTSRYGTYQSWVTKALVDFGDSYQYVDIDNMRTIQPAQAELQQIFDLCG